jgi:DNA-binding MarR family transcriptional regulator
MKRLTKKQFKAAEFINQHIIENDNFPTHKQIAKELGNPRSASTSLVLALYAKGWITQQRDARSYKRTEAMKERMMG